MYEKISDRDTRVEKVELIRQKILSEIINLLSDVNDTIKHVESAECRESAILKGSALLQLRCYVESDLFLMRSIAEYYDEGIVIYEVSIDVVNMMMSDWFGKNIAQRWVDYVDERGRTHISKIFFATTTSVIVFTQFLSAVCMRAEWNQIKSS